MNLKFALNECKFWPPSLHHSSEILVHNDWDYNVCTSLSQCELLSPVISWTLFAHSPILMYQQWDAQQQQGCHSGFSLIFLYSFSHLSSRTLSALPTAVFIPQMKLNSCKFFCLVVSVTTKHLPVLSHRMTTLLDPKWAVASKLYLNCKHLLYNVIIPDSRTHDTYDTKYFHLNFTIHKCSWH